MRALILLCILFPNRFLCRFRKALNEKAWLLFARHAVYAHGVAGNLYGAFGAGKDQPFTLLAAIHKIHPQAQVESFAIIEQPQHHVWHVAPIIPKAQSTCGHAARWAVRAGDEVRATEEMHKQIAGHAAAISLPLAPLKE